MHRPNRRIQFSIGRLLIATAAVAIIMPWIEPSIQWSTLRLDRPSVTVPDSPTMLIGGKNWHRVRRQINSTDSSTHTPAHLNAITDTSNNSLAIPLRDTNATVVTSTPRTIIEETNEELVSLPTSRHDK